jgi:hypothetical protein
MSTIQDQVLIHIGYHKTGTTWLQQELFVHSNEIFEPVSDRNTHQSLLGRLFFTHKNGYLLSPFEFDKDHVVREYHRIASRDDRDFINKIPVVSHERLCGNPHFSGFDSREIVHRLKGVFPNGKVLIVIREQKSMYLSNYYQYLSMGGALGIERYHHNPYDRKGPGFSPEHFIYLPLVEEYYKAFGKENVLVLPYEMFSREPNIYFGYIGQLIGMQIVFSLKKHAVKRNVKVNRYINYKMRWTGFFSTDNSITGNSPFFSPFGRAFFKGLKSLLGFFIPQSVEARLLERQKNLIEQYIGDLYKETNEKLSKLIGINLSDYGYH